ncbi:MAG: helix-turn-helix transcriptional regulator [Thaumarchaeota archaeon]|nr:helix-turn-helix transcriptional regulator [Nitrososphaerota archaeon]
MRIPRNLRERIMRLMEFRNIRDKSVEQYVKELLSLSKNIAVEEEKLRRASKIFEALSDFENLKILMLLKKEKEMCVCELMMALNMKQPAVSYHLRLLRERRLVKSIRRGKWIFYSIADRKLLRAIEKVTEYV